MSRIQHASNFPRGYRYKITQVTLKEKVFGSGSSTHSLSVLEAEINRWSMRGYKLHSMSTSESSSKGLGAGGDRIQITLIFEKESESIPEEYIDEAYANTQDEDAEKRNEMLAEKQEKMWNTFVYAFDDVILEKVSRLKFLGLSNMQIYSKIYDSNPEVFNLIPELIPEIEMLIEVARKNKEKADEEMKLMKIAKAENIWIKRGEAVYECPICGTLTSTKCTGRRTCFCCGNQYSKDVVEFFNE